MEMMGPGSGSKVANGGKAEAGNAPRPGDRPRPLIRQKGMKTIALTLALGASLAAAAPAPAPGTAAPARPAFLSLETPLQMAGQVGGGLSGALLAGWIGANIGATRAHNACLEDIDPDFSDECGWAALGGGMVGLMIGAPIGHALGALSVGALQGKHGAPVAALSAIAGDAGMLLLAIGLHSALDGKVVPNGKLDPFLTYAAAAGMVAIPVVTQSVWDYHVRIALEPGVALGATAEETRYALRVAQVRF
jgi:hypothetical protein